MNASENHMSNCSCIRISSIVHALYEINVCTCTTHLIFGFFSSFFGFDDSLFKLGKLKLDKKNIVLFIWTGYFPTFTLFIRKSNRKNSRDTIFISFMVRIIKYLIDSFSHSSRKLSMNPNYLFPYCE